MSINAKGIQHFLWRLIRFSGICCYKFVRKFPDISGVLIFVLCLYIFFPRVFFYFIYTSPVIVSTAIYIRFYLKAKYHGSKKDDGERLSADGKIVNTPNGPSLRPQKSVRRNARKEVLEWDGKDSEEKDVLFPRSTSDSLSSKTNFLEENSKVSFDRLRSSSPKHGEGSPQDETRNDRTLGDPNSVLVTSKSHRLSDDSFQGSSGTGPGDVGGGELEVKSLGEVDEAGNNKAARDDKKNRMDLGLAATERYKRLESLIAKRRAKKLFRMAIEKSLKGLHNVPPSQLGPILMAKINDGVSSNLDEEELQIPGSAPSFKQDSFDLPYGPQEEKPDLMADGFQQEFMPANQKEMFFSRHESFCRGPWYQLASTRNPNYDDFNAYYDAEKRLVEGKPGKGGHQQLNSSGMENDVGLVEVEESNHKEAINLSDEEKEKIIESSNNRIEIEGEKTENTRDQEPGSDSGSEVRMDTDSIKNHDSCSSSSSENTEPVLDQTIKSHGVRNEHVRRALKLAIPRKGGAMNRLSFDSSPSPSERRGKTDFSSFYSAYRLPCLTPTYSIASDLQVEVSEVGSPPLATDGTASSVDGDSVIYDGDVERDINSESEELWGGSFNLTIEEANRERLRELNDIIEEEPVGVASTSPSEHEAKQNLNSPSSLSSRKDVTENCSTHQDSSDIKRGDLETSYEVKSTMKSGKEVEESQPSKYIEKDTRTLTENNTRDAPNAVQSRSNLKSIPDTTVDQNAAEDNILNRRLRDSIAKAVNRRLMLEQFSISSSLSPRSVLAQNILADQMPTSEQRMQDLPQSVRENMARNNLAYEQAHENLTPNMPRISHELVENSLDRSSGNCSLGELKALKKAIDKGNKNINTSAVDEREQGKKLMTNEGKSVILLRPEDITGPGKSNEQEAAMNETEAVEPDYAIIVESAKERENSAAEVDRICKVNESVADNVTNKEIKNDVLEREGALRILDKLKAVVEPSNTTGETSAGSIGNTEHKSKKLAEAEANAGLSTSAGETSSFNDIKNDGKMQNMTTQEGDMDALQSGELREENLKVIESILNVDNIAGLSTSAGETNSLNNIKNDEKMQNMTGQEGVDASHSGEVRENNIKVIESILNVDNLAKVISINHEAVEASKPTESEVKAAKMTKYDTGIDPSKPEKQNPKSDDTETTEPINSPEKVIKEANIVRNINDLAANEKEGEKLTANEGEYQFSITQEGVVAPEKSNELELDLNKTEPVESNYTSIVETAKEREDSAAEVDRICKVNESASDNIINKEIKSDVLEHEDALQILGKLEAVLESSNTTGESSSGSVEDTEHESKSLAEADTAGLSTSAGETNSLNNIKNGEGIQTMTRQEDITDASQSGEDNLKAIDIISDVDNITKGKS